MIIIEIISSICKVVMFLTTCYLFFNGLKYRNNENLIFSFWYLSVFSLIDSVLYIYFILINKDINSYKSISNWTQLIYILIEFNIISNFLLEINKIKFKKLLRIIIVLLSLIIFCVTFINNWSFKEKYYSIITIIELVFINSLSIRYLLFISPDIPDLNSKQKSIIVKGIFLFINITSPYYVIIQYVISTPNSIMSALSFINDIGYTVLFIYIIKSLKCQYKK